MPKEAFILLIISGIFLTLERGQIFKVFGLVFLLFGGIFFYTNPIPDLIIDREGRLVSVRSTDEKLYFNSRRSGRFARESWLEKFGQRSSPHWFDMSKTANNPILNCDTEGCILIVSKKGIKKYQIGFPIKNSAFRDDCFDVDLIITSLRAPSGCDFDTLVIDRTDFNRNGSHVIFLNDSIKIESVGGINGVRLWSNPNLFDGD